MVLVMREVVVGHMEWAYHESDGRHKMSAYANAALRTARHPLDLSVAEKQSLENSNLSRFLGWEEQE